MSRRKRIVSVLALLSICLFAFFWLTWQRRQRAMPPLKIGLWYWHHPFALPNREAQQLHAAGVTQLYIRAGTFIRAGDSVRMTLLQHWATGAPGLETHLVFNFDYSVVRGFAQLNLDHIARDVSDAVRTTLMQARLAGLHPVGVQFDFDCATHSLSRYARLLKQLRSALVGRGCFAQISITALPTWYGSRAVEQVAAAVDFMTPQYYEPRLGPTLDRYATISCLPLLEHGMQAAARVGRPFYVGIPAYGHALMYDDYGSLVGLYRDMNVLDAAHHRAFRVARTFPSDPDGRPATRRTAIGENLIDLVATKPGESGRGHGYHLLYDLPTAELVRQHLALIRAQRPPECHGVILFCYPEPDGTQAVPLPALSAALTGRSANPDLKVRIAIRRSSWDLIETGVRDRRRPAEIFVSVTNVGNSDTFFAPDAVSLTLTFDRVGMEEANPNDFDSIDAAYVELSNGKSGHETAWQSSSLARANALRLRRFHLAVGETARIGPILAPTDATEIRGVWAVRDPNGFDTRSGDIAPVKLNHWQ
jgi:hypothetical protein